MLGRIRCDAPGPTLICVAGIHGNEPAGVWALRAVLAKLAQDRSGLRGDFVGLTGNRAALAEDRRYLVSDLNRMWEPERIERLREATTPLHAEEAELRELDAELRKAVADARGPVSLIDLHSTSGPGPAFVAFDDTLRNRRFAAAIPVPQVLGLEEELTATLENHMSALGLTTIGFEAGQHRDPASVERAEAAVWIGLEASGVLAPGSRAEVSAARARLLRDRRALPPVFEVRYRHGITEDQEFRMLPGFTSFEPIDAGQTLAETTAGPVVAPRGGRLFMPLYQKLGNDGFFVVQPVRRGWLGLSALLRRLRLERILHWLPGVRRHPELPNTFIVDQRRARWLAREIFHLLGFKRLGKDGPQLTMTRRNEKG